MLRRLAMLVTVIAALLLAACGGGDEASDGGNGEFEPALPAPSVGHIQPLPLPRR